MFSILTQIIPWVTQPKRASSASRRIAKQQSHIRQRFLRPTIFPNGAGPKENWDAHLTAHIQEHA